MRRDPADARPRAGNGAAHPHRRFDPLRGEWVIGIRGTVKSRGEQFSKKENKMVSAANPNIATGEVEITVLEATVFNKAETVPFGIEDKLDTREEVRPVSEMLTTTSAQSQAGELVYDVINGQGELFRRDHELQEPRQHQRRGLRHP